MLTALRGAVGGCRFAGADVTSFRDKRRTSSVNTAWTLQHNSLASTAAAVSFFYLCYVAAGSDDFVYSEDDLNAYVEGEEWLEFVHQS